MNLDKLILFIYESIFPKTISITNDVLVASKGNIMSVTTSYSGSPSINFETVKFFLYFLFFGYVLTSIIFDLLSKIKATEIICTLIKKIIILAIFFLICLKCLNTSTETIFFAFVICHLLHYAFFSFVSMLISKKHKDKKAIIRFFIRTIFISLCPIICTFSAKKFSNLETIDLIFKYIELILEFIFLLFPAFLLNIIYQKIVYGESQKVFSKRNR